MMIVFCPDCKKPLEVQYIFVGCPHCEKPITRCPVCNDELVILRYESHYFAICSHCDFAVVKLVKTPASYYAAYSLTVSVGGQVFFESVDMAKTRQCPSCKTFNPNDAKFCTNCGIEL